MVLRNPALQWWSNWEALTQIIRVAIIDDDIGVHDMIASLICDAEGLQFVGVFSGCDDVMENMIDEIPDVALMDINLPGRSGFECVEVLRMEISNIKIFMLPMTAPTSGFSTHCTWVRWNICNPLIGLFRISSERRLSKETNYSDKKTHGKQYLSLSHSLACAEHGRGSV